MTIGDSGISFEFFNTKKTLINKSNSFDCVFSLHDVREIRVKITDFVDFSKLERSLFCLKNNYKDSSISIFTNGERINYNSVSHIGRYIDRFYVQLFSHDLKTNRRRGGANLDKSVLKKALDKLLELYGVESYIIYNNEHNDLFNLEYIHRICEFCEDIGVKKMCAVYGIDENIDFNKMSFIPVGTSSGKNKSFIGELNGVKVALRFFNILKPHTGGAIV